MPSTTRGSRDIRMNKADSFYDLIELTVWLHTHSKQGMND